MWFDIKLTRRKFGSEGCQRTLFYIGIGCVVLQSFHKNWAPTFLSQISRQAPRLKAKPVELQPIVLIRYLAQVWFQFQVVRRLSKNNTGVSWLQTVRVRKGWLILLCCLLQSVTQVWYFFGANWRVEKVSSRETWMRNAASRVCIILLSTFLKKKANAFHVSLIRIEATMARLLPLG